MTVPYYHFIIEYKAGDKFEYAYEVNLTSEQVLDILANIEAKVPEITFDGRRIYPKRIRVRRIYESESKFTRTSEFLHAKFPLGYMGDFSGQEVTRTFLSKKELLEKVNRIKEPKVIGEIEDTISKLIQENDEDKGGIIVSELVSNYRSKAVDKIISAIQTDETNAPDEHGIISTSNSRKWNSVALSYSINNLGEDSIKIFSELLKKEPNNPATQNNFGVALLNLHPSNKSNIAKAKELFQKAFESDKQRGEEEAKNLPAYQNLINLERGSPKHGQTIVIGSPQYHYILFMDIVGFSRPTWYGTVQVEKINYLTDYTRTLLTELGLNYMRIPVLPTGDGMVLFFEQIEKPIEFAMRISRHLHIYNETQDSDSKLELRIGIHAGESFPVQDLHRGGNRCGPAINSARRVMDFGESWHILCSHEYGNSLIKLFGPTYGAYLYDCGSYEAKHGEIINIYNIFNEDFGNVNCPPK